MHTYTCMHKHTHPQTLTSTHHTHAHNTHTQCTHTHITTHTHKTTHTQQQTCTQTLAIYHCLSFDFTSSMEYLHVNQTTLFIVAKMLAWTINV